jgi:branched-chain amino acid transport system ATP-binding protein
VLAVEQLQVQYGRIPAVRDLSLNVQRGEIVCVVGPNGAGKSTTLRAIAGGLRPSRGDITLNGNSILNRSPEDIARLGISLVPEGRHVFTQLTVGENIRLGAGMRRDSTQVEQDHERVLGYFPFLRERLATPGGKLSGGEQQQLVIARALMTSAKLVLLDEPSLGLAPMMVDTVYEIIARLRDAGITFLVVEQSTHRALEAADRVYVLRSGQVQLHGQASALTDQQVEQAYFGFDHRPRNADAHF